MTMTLKPVSPSLVVLTDLPCTATAGIFLFGPDTAFDCTTHKRYYHCPKCGGWIEGMCSTRREDNLGLLCGRRGTAYDCIRCGYEIDFVGIVS